MSILAWVVLGIIAGYLASLIVGGTGSGIVMDLVLGVVGAVVGGLIMSYFSEAPVTGFNLYSVLVATLGAVVVLLIYHALSRGGPKHA
jgi:uncharacterized membrane protein YeaQ/YmgE (transglycosylase-associated protein family)